MLQSASVTSAELEIGSRELHGNIFSGMLPRPSPSTFNVCRNQCKRLCTNSEEARPDERAATGPKTTMW